MIGVYRKFKKLSLQLKITGGDGMDNILSIWQKYKTKEDLISVLQDIQENYGYISKENIENLSKVSGIKESKIYGVVTFYSQFRTEPVGKYLISICKGTACHVNGADLIESRLVDVLGVKEGEITGDGLFSYENVACLGCCSLSPAVMINGRVFGNVTPESIEEIVEEYRGISDEN